jgi:LysR family transcriptional regulator, nitrogen assimilation regulatory protein
MSMKQKEKTDNPYNAIGFAYGSGGRMMDLRQLRFLVRTIESSSISQAARALHITQPSLSQRLRQLEAELGVALFERTPAGIRPTEVGTMVADRSRAILRMVDNLVVEARAVTHEPSGEVFIGLPTTMALHLTVPLVKAVRSRFPKVSLRVSEGMSGHIQEWVISGRLDLAILYTDESIDGLRIEKITDEDLCLISRHDAAGPTLDVPFADLAHYPLVLPGPDHGLRRSIEKVRLTTRTSLDIAVEIDSLPHLKRLAIEGGLHTILPKAACREEIRLGQISARRIVDPNLRRPIALARPTNRPNSLATQNINELLKALVQEAVGRHD